MIDDLLVYALLALGATTSILVGIVASVTIDPAAVVAVAGLATFLLCSALILCETLVEAAPDPRRN